MISRHILFTFIISGTVACSSVKPAPLEISDPLESVNRKVFAFNDTVDTYVLKPVSEGYDYILPSWAKKGVKNFFSNIRYPIYLVSDIVRGKPCDANDHTARFVINSTVGVLGLIDVAKDLEVPHKPNDIGVALGSQGVVAGPYIVLPFLGPSTVRDFTGTLLDQFLNPMSYTPADVQIGARAVEVIDIRHRLKDAIDLGKESSLDYYSYMQSSYYQYRQGLIEDRERSDVLTPAASPLDEDTFVGEESPAESSGQPAPEVKK